MTNTALIEGMNAEQSSVVEHGTSPLLVAAGAGCGKTKVLVHRVARLVGDGVMFGPQVSWADVERLARIYRAARAGSGRAGPGTVGASRCLMVGRSKEDAAARARQYLERTFAMYSAWSMQEETMVPLQLDFERGLDEWTIYGSAADCVETIARARDEIGLDGIGFTIYSLPREVKARIEYLRMIAEEIVRPAAALGR